MFLQIGNQVINTDLIVSLRYVEGEYTDGEPRLYIDTSACRHSQLILKGQDACAVYDYVCCFMAQEVRVTRHAGDIPAPDEEETYHAQVCGCGAPAAKCKVEPTDLIDDEPPVDSSRLFAHDPLDDMDPDMRVMWDELNESYKA